MLSAFLLGQIMCIPVQPAAEIVKTVSYEFLNLPTGGYEFSYELSDGSYRRETSAQKEIGGEKVLSIDGVFGFIGDDGNKYDVTYNAGEEGFVAHGKHLPTNEEEKQERAPIKPILRSRPEITVKVAKVEEDISPDAVRSLVGYGR